MKNTTYDNLKELYDNSVARYADRKCFSVYHREDLTYREFALRVEAVAEILKDAGLDRGDKVALLGQNMPNWCAGYFAAVTSGLVIVPILPDFSAEEVNKIIAHSEAKALIVTRKQEAKIYPGTRAALNVAVRADDLSVLQRREGVGRVWKEAPIDAGSVASIIYTSGTTSQPKGVMLSHRSLCAQSDMVLRLQDVNENDVFLSVLPLSHAYECSLGMLLPFRSGAWVTYIDKAPTANVLLPVLRELRPTMMLSVPLIIEKIFKSQVLSKVISNGLLKRLYGTGAGRRILHRLAGRKLYTAFGGRLRFFGIGGSKLDPRVERFLLEARFPYAIGYGLTETAPLVAGVNPGMVRLQSTGPVLDGMRMRIDNPNPETGEGEIVVTGPNVMSGYYKNPEATAEAFTADGWFRTKDLGVLDRDGYLYIKGRLGNMIVGASGENIYPEEIEHVINEHSLVVESLVKEERGRLVALVCFNREELEKKYQSVKGDLETRIEALKQDVLRYVNARVNKFSRIALVVEQGRQFEKTPTHKIKRFLYK